MPEAITGDPRTELHGPAHPRPWRVEDAEDPLTTELQRLRHQRSVLADLARDSLADVPLPELFDRTCRWLAAALDVPVVAVFEQIDDHCVVRAAWGLGPEAIGLSTGAVDPEHPLRSVSVNRLLVVDDTDAQDVAAPRGLEQLRSFVAVGIQGGAFTGRLAVHDLQPRGWESDVAPFLETVASVLSEAARRTHAEHGLRVVVETAPVGITYSDRTGRITYANPAAEAILGVDRSGIETRGYDHAAWQPATSDGARVAPADLPIARVLAGGQPVSDVDLVVSRPGGDRRVLAVNAAPVTAEDGNLVGVVTVFRDVTDERESQRRTRSDEEQLRTLLAQIPGIVWTASPTGTITSWRGALTDELDLGVEPVGADARTVLAASSYDALVDAVEGTLDDGQPAAAAVEFEERDRWWRSTVRPVLDAAGAVTSVVGLTLDVTSERAAIDAHRASEERLRSLFDNTLEAILLVNDRGRFIDANPAACRLTGFRHDELVSMSVSELVPGADANLLGEPFVRLGRAQGECRVRRADGQLVETEFSAVGHVVPGVHLTSLHDITDRRLTERALRRSEERFRRLAENAQDIIFRLRLGPDPVFEYISPAVRTVLGHAPEQLYRDPASALDLLHPEDRHLLGGQGLSCRDQLRSPLVMRWRRADGSYIWVEERHRYETDHTGRVVAVEGVARDVTARVEAERKLIDALALEREAAERLRHLDEMKNAFLTAVSHELRTPLTALVGFSELLRRAHGDLPPERLELLLDRLTGNAHRLDELLDGLLDVDRLTHGLVEPDRRQVDASALTLATLESIDTSGHALMVQVEPVIIDVDPPKYERIVEHLVSNAVVHTPAGTRIWVRCHPHHGGVLLSVEDDGPGIAGWLRDAIVEPFTLGDSEAAQVGGAGIGLTLVAGYTKLHGGTLSVDEREGGGAVFHVWLPATAGGGVTGPS